ncbi:MAG TPA: lactate utilization protein [Geobacteraceae bacterium]|nr:lactate utilization protein [Geobacteraceae bacterium]
MTLTDELMTWHNEQRCEKAVEALGQNGFIASYCRTAAEARDYILSQGGDAASVGFGGSRTVVDLGVEPVFAGQGKEILNHGAPGLEPAHKMEIMRRQLTCDLFLTSANAVTLSGWLVNIDGNGNRVAALTFGPKKTIVVAGRNKLVDGDLAAAIHRVKNVAAPPNAKRLNCNTPCAKTGFCANCNSPERICRILHVMDRKPRMADLHVLIVNEDMGL